MAQTPGTRCSHRSIAGKERQPGSSKLERRTLHFANEGQAVALVNATDDLSGVLDDATVVTEPSSADGLAVSRSGNVISISGEVAAGATSTVTYTVKVNADGARGDNLATNFLLDDGETPPDGGECDPADPDRPNCTSTPIGRLLVAAFEVGAFGSGWALPSDR